MHQFGGANTKRKKFSVQRYGFDATDSEYETEEETQTVIPKKWELKRSDMMKPPSLPSPPMTFLGQTSNEAIQNIEQRTPLSNKKPRFQSTVSTLSHNSLAAQGPSYDLPSSEQTFDSVDLDRAPQSVKCHCPHQEHWAKELLTVALRTEQYLHKKVSYCETLQSKMIHLKIICRHITLQQAMKYVACLMN